MTRPCHYDAAMMTREAMDRKDIGSRISRARDARDIPVRRLADAVGISVRHMQRIQAGEKGPSLDMLKRIADALGVPVDALLPGGEQACADSTPEADSDFGGASEVGP